MGHDLLDALLSRQDLSEPDAGRLFDVLVDETAPEALKAGLLVALRAKGETPDEIRGLALRMRAMAKPLPTDTSGVVVDTCGTGGDGAHSFNVSTATALVLAAAGIRVAKHGNRSVSSKCGSADVLEAAGVTLFADPADAARQLDDTGFTFLFAPSFHPAMKAVAPVRRALKARTVMNILGPLTNPARPAYQLVGAYDVDVARLMAETLSGMPIERCFVVHGAKGWDEATTFGPFHLFDVTPGRVRAFEVDPSEYGLPPHAPEALAGADAAGNAAMLRDVLDGEKGARRDAVLLNAALVLQLIGAHPAPKDAVAAAAAVIDDGRARALFERLTTP